MRKLSCHGGSDIAAVNREAFIEQKQSCTGHHQFGQWVCKFCQFAHGVCTHGHGKQSTHHYHLECNAIWQHHIKKHNEQCWHHHVKAVCGETRIPIHTPTSQTPVWQQHITQIRRPPDMSAHVSTRRSVVLQNEIWMNNGQHNQYSTKNNCCRAH